MGSLRLPPGSQGGAPSSRRSRVHMHEIEQVGEMTEQAIDVARLNETVREEALLVQAAVNEVKKVIVGQKALLDRLMVALLCRGHILVEGVPGLAKTLAVKTLGQVLD